MDKILVLTTGYPRDRLDNSNIFIKHLYEQLSVSNWFNFLVLAADGTGKIHEVTKPNLKIKRYHYWFKKNQRLVYGDSILSNLKENPRLMIQAFSLVIVQMIRLPLEILRYKPSLIHAHWAVPCGLVAVLWGKFFNLPVLITSHGSDVYGFSRGWKRLLLRWVYNNTDCINAVSKTMADDIRGLVSSQAQHKIWIRAMGVDQKKFKFISGAKQKLGFGDNEKVILFVGRLSEGKGLQYLLKAWPDVLSFFRTAKLQIIGTGNEEKNLKKQVQDLGLGGTVTFKGVVPNDQLPLYYSAAEALVLPSVRTEQGQEGTPVSIIEALMTGCWAIASKVGGIADLADLTPIKIVEPGNSRDLSKKIIECLHQGRPASDQKINNFTLTEVARAYADKYKILVK